MIRRIIQGIASAFLWCWGLLLFSAILTILILASIVLRGRALDALVKFGCRLMVAALGIRVRIQDLENHEADTPYIVMMNHVNCFDPLVLYGVFPGRARAIEEESHFHWPLYGWLITRLGNIPVDRKNMRKSYEALKQAAARIQQHPEDSFVVLPEGTRTRNGKLGVFKKGGFLLALESKRPVLPIIQRGSYAIKRKNSWVIKPGVVELIIEKSIPSQAYGPDEVARFSQDVRAVFLKHIE